MTSSQDWGWARRIGLAQVHLGRSLHVALHRAPPSPLLTRGFHWINEVPFNR